jgi:four helix bundle protein
MDENSELKGYRRLLAWQRADQLACDVYIVTRAFPDDERFGLVSQMRRAAVSVAANIAEGYAHVTKRERRRFYTIARASLTELEYYLDFSHFRLQYLDRPEFQELANLRGETGRLLHGLIRSSN